MEAKSSREEPRDRARRSRRVSFRADTRTHASSFSHVIIRDFSRGRMTKSRKVRRPGGISRLRRARYRARERDTAIPRGGKLTGENGANYQRGLRLTLKLTANNGNGCTANCETRTRGAKGGQAAVQAQSFPP